MFGLVTRAYLRQVYTVSAGVDSEQPSCPTSGAILETPPAQSPSSSRHPLPLSHFSPPHQSPLSNSPSSFPLASFISSFNGSFPAPFVLFSPHPVPHNEWETSIKQKITLTEGRLERKEFLENFWLDKRTTFVLILSNWLRSPRALSLPLYVMKSDPQTQPQK